MLYISNLNDSTANSHHSRSKHWIVPHLFIASEEIVEGDLELVKEVFLHTSDDISKLDNVLWTVFNDVCEEKGDLLRFNVFILL